MLLADRVPAVSNRQKAFSKVLTLKLLGFSDRDLKLEAPLCTDNNIGDTLKIHLCLLHTGRVALCIPSDYTDSSRSGRY